MAYILQHRRDTATNWRAVNPILADAEIGFILDLDPNTGQQKSSLYKIGDGKTRWNDLPLFGFSGNIFADFTSGDLNTTIANRQAIVTNFIQKKQITDLTVVEGEDYSDYIVSKSALIAKFAEVIQWINQNTSDIDTLERYSCLTLSEEQVQILQAFADDFGTYEETMQKIGEIETTLASHTTSLSDLDGRVSKLSNDFNNQPKSQILSEKKFSDFQQDVESGQAQYEENTLYFIYKEEIKQ